MHRKSSIFPHVSSTLLLTCIVVMGNILPLLNPLGGKEENPYTVEWANHGLMDPVLFESILFHSSTHLDSMHRRPWSASTYYHQGRTARLLNERLSSKGALTDDNVIAAVGLFAYTGVSLVLPPSVP